MQIWVENMFGLNVSENDTGLLPFDYRNASGMPYKSSPLSLPFSDLGSIVQVGCAHSE